MDAEFEEKMRNLEKDGEELNWIKASIAAKKRQGSVIVIILRECAVI